MKTGIELIAAERQRQISAEGFWAAHDDKHKEAELAEAAKCYLAYGIRRFFHRPHLGKIGTGCKWPWDWKWWKPDLDPIRNLVKAGALIAAEIDRLRRNGDPPV